MDSGRGVPALAFQCWWNPCDPVELTWLVPDFEEIISAELNVWAGHCIWTGTKQLSLQLLL